MVDSVYVVIVIISIIVSFFFGCLYVRSRTDGVLWIENVEDDKIKTTFELYTNPSNLAKNGVFLLRVKNR